LGQTVASQASERHQIWRLPRGAAVKPSSTLPYNFLKVNQVETYPTDKILPFKTQSGPCIRRNTHTFNFLEFFFTEFPILILLQFYVKTKRKKGGGKKAKERFLERLNPSHA